MGTWSPEQINERRLAVMNQCSQTRINRGFSLIIDDSGHRKSGNFTAGVGRQYIGAVGKTDNGNVVVTTHLYDGQKSLPLDIVRDKKSLEKHFILVFCAYSFILWQKLTGGLRRRWSLKPLNTFVEALEAFRTAISYRFVNWLTENMDVFAAYKASLGLIWA
jgi:DDE superfamily endonuclease